MYWNKETRNEVGEYFRDGNWGVSKTPQRPENFTTTSPPQEAFEGIPCDWIYGEWVLDESELAKKELAELDSEGEMNRTVEEIVDALAIAAPEVYALISEYGKAKIADRKAKRGKIHG